MRFSKVIRALKTPLNSIFVKRHATLILVISIYLISIAIISPWGNFSSGDDLYYLIQTKAFSQGIFTKSAFIDAAFVLQGLIGMVWSFIFGLSFLSLRILTIVTSIICIIGVYKILIFKRVKSSLIFLSLLTIIFNPFFYTSALTYLTEIYFLAFIVWCLYFLIKFSVSDNYTDLVLASILGGLSVMIRQFGIVMFPLMLLVYYLKRKHHINYKELVTFSVIFIGISSIGIFWPKYPSPLVPLSLSPLSLINIKSLYSRILTNWKITSYIGFSLAPLSAVLFFRHKKLTKAFILLAATVIAYYIYQQNVFGIGNVLYLEGFGAKSYLRIRDSLFNNVPVKITVSFFAELSFVTLIASFVTSTKKWVKRPENSIAGLTVLLFYIIVAFTNHLYDRYYLNFLILFIIFFTLAINSEGIRANKTSYIALFFMAMVVFFLTIDNNNDLKVKWNLANDLVKSGYKITDIFLDDTFVKYSNISQSDNYLGATSAFPQQTSFICFVQNYSRPKPNLVSTGISAVISKLERVITRSEYFPKTTVQDFGYSRGMARNCGEGCSKKDEKDYFSPVYNLIGKQLFVRSFCFDNP